MKRDTDPAVLLLSELVELQRQSLAELRAIRAERRGTVDPEAGAALLDAIEDYFGDGVWNAQGVLEAAGEAGHADIAQALAACGLRSSVGLGRYLAKLAEMDEDLERLPDVRGAALWRIVRR